jgi:predicted nucleotidyltransferase
MHPPRDAAANAFADRPGKPEPCAKPVGVLEVMALRSKQIATETPCPAKLTPMRPSEALSLHRTQIREIALRHRVSDVRVFGSVLHGDDADGSDLDLLVEATPGVTLFDLGGMQDELEQLMGVPVDVVTPRDLPAAFRERVMTEACLV